MVFNHIFYIHGAYLTVGTLATILYNYLLQIPQAKGFGKNITFYSRMKIKTEAMVNQRRKRYFNFKFTVNSWGYLAWFTLSCVWWPIPLPTMLFSEKQRITEQYFNVLKFCDGIINLQTYINHSNKTHGAIMCMRVCAWVHIATSLRIVHLSLLLLLLQILNNFDFSFSISRQWCYCGGHGFIIHHNSNSQRNFTYKALILFRQQYISTYIVCVFYIVPLLWQQKDLFQGGVKSETSKFYCL